MKSLCLTYIIWIAKEAENNKCYVNNVFWKDFWKPYKTINKSISSDVADLFYLLKEPSKRTWALKRNSRPLEQTKGTPRALEHLRQLKGLGHLRHFDIWHLCTWGTRALKGHLGTRALKAFTHSGTRALEVHLGTQALWH